MNEDKCQRAPEIPSVTAQYISHPGPWRRAGLLLQQVRSEVKYGEPGPQQEKTICGSPFKNPFKKHTLAKCVARNRDIYTRWCRLPGCGDEAVAPFQSNSAATVSVPHCIDLYVWSISLPMFWSLTSISMASHFDTQCV